MTNFLNSPDKRGKTYAYTLLGCIVAIAVIGLLSIWGVAPKESGTYKAIASLVIIGTLSGFLYTLNAGSDKKYAKHLVYIVGGSTVTLAILVILQLWTSVIEDLLFGKVALTLVVFGLLAAFILAMSDDFFENKKLKDENYLD